MVQILSRLTICAEIAGEACALAVFTAMVALLATIVAG
jgi:hypothetical protein